MDRRTINTRSDVLCKKRTPGAIALAVASLLASPAVLAFEIDTGESEVKMRWDTSVKYSAGVRLKDRSSVLTGDANSDDGDRNFAKGLISNRVDLLTDFDVTYRNFGARVSGAAWYDAVYNSSTDNNSPFTYNARSVPNTEFPKTARELNGRKAELLDAFLFAKGELGEMPGLVRVGRHALLYGESLFFGNNGIAAAQQPVDVIKAQSVPNLQFKEIIRPVNQVSGQLQIKPNVSIGGYYQLEWEKTLLPAPGSYFSTTDFLFEGGERLLTGPTSSLARGPNKDARDSGQGGLQLRWSPSGTNFDLGFYAARYHDKGSQTVVMPRTGTYARYFHEDIRTFGVSASTTFGAVNVAGEVSVRRNTPLVRTSSTDLFGVVPVFAGGPSAPSDNRDNTVYPVGNSAHANISFLSTLDPNFIAQESGLVGEIAWHRATSVTRNAALVDANSTRDAWGLRLVYTPTYRQVLPGLDISVPVGISYFPQGRSSVIPGFGTHKGGIFNLGVAGKYLGVWDLGLNYTHFYGPEDRAVTLVPGGTVFTYKQSLKDRNFLSLSVSRTF